MLSKEEYKKYPFPTRILLAYIILSILGIFLLDQLATLIIMKTDYSKGFTFRIDKDPYINYIYLIGGYIIELIIFSFIFAYFCGNKTYRGTGLYNFTTTISLLSPIILAVIIFLLDSKNIKYTFFNLVSLILESSLPIFFKYFINKMTNRCFKCGLINTFVLKDTKVDSLGKQHKFHNEGGYSYEKKTTGYVSDIPVEVNTTHYVPETTVYDGLYEKKRTTEFYKCIECGYIKKKTTETETKID
ncbi:MAG: hypothetical protein IJX17_00700 [Clostridia bacterium]|nr:hypothetical protein [Clostridia bacterium]